jgi:hypothetical protein
MTNDRCLKGFWPPEAFLQVLPVFEKEGMATLKFVPPVDKFKEL